ncbi:translocation/assembly module TamB [Zeaxanthinibacter sp. PT1]|nr:translocation/assembly module TamB [Zeaxanthinibacter sp. PT1]MDC6352744.1 translocation/assembly module TamB [Zeaxanthinibacter sp. PT1]
MRTILVLLLICVLGTLILSLPFVQTRLAKYATDSINGQYDTNISIDKLKLSLLSWDTTLKGVYIEDYRKDTLFYIRDISTSVLHMGNLVKGRLEFGDIEMNGLNFKLKTYEGETNTNLNVFIEKLDDKQPRPPGTPPFFFSTGLVEINNSKFRLLDENLEREQILYFRNLNIRANDFVIVGPKVQADISDMSFQSTRELQVQQLATEFQYTKEQMRFDSLHLETGESTLNGKLVFNYQREDFKDFMNKVQLEAEFVESTVAFDEINKLYDQFGKKKTVTFSSQLSGTLNDLTVNDLFLNSDNTGIRGDFNFKNLFIKDEPFVLRADIRNITTSYYQLRALLPNILGTSLPSSFQNLGQFTIRGDATITESSIDSRVNLTTAIGDSYADLNLTSINNIDNATYEGFISLMNFDLGAFLEDPKLGTASMDLNVEGQGFVAKTLNTEIIGEVYHINFNKYKYENVNVSGILKDQLFDGSLVASDPNLDMSFTGLADFGSDVNTFNFRADVKYADFRKLNFINDSVSVFKGNVNMDIKGSDLDNIVGEVKFTETSYQNVNDTYYFDDFQVTSSFGQDSLRTIDINSPDIITGYMRGNFKVNELGKLVQNSIGSIYTNYRPYKISEGQKLAFNFNIYNKIVEVFFPEVEFGPNTFIRGNIIADEGDFKLNFKSPSIKAFGNELDSIDVKIDNKNPLFNTFVSVADVMTPYYNARNFNLINTTLKDTLFFRTEFKGGSEYNDSYNLNFYHTFNAEKKSVIGLKRSEVSFKNHTWVLNKDGNQQNKVILNRTLDSIRIEEIVMNNNEEQIKLKGEIADSTYKDLEMEFRLVSLGKITPTLDSLDLEGEITGNLNILQKDNIYLPSSNLKISDFGVNSIRLGDMSIGIVGNRDLTDFVVNTQITQNGIEKFSVIGNILNQGEIPEASLLVNFRDFQLEPFSPLGEGVITNIRGSLNGSAQVAGRLDNPDISGLLNLNDAGIAIPYLNVDYDFGPNSTVRLFNQSFDFQNVKLTDIAHQTNAILDGTITHDFWGDWELDFDVDTEGDRFLILNTDFEEEVLYYGTGFVNGTGAIFGPTRALNITFDGATARGSSLKIPISDVASVGDYSFINFIEKGAIEVEESERILKEYQGLEMEFDLVVTPDAEVEIIVDPKTGSSLKGTGEGILLIQINTNGKFNMYGDFVAVSGRYNYKFGGVIDKTFMVQPGGTISWTGDPLGAQLQMEAVYSLNANPAPLLDNSGYSRRIPTEVVVQLTGELEQPTIDFNIDFPGTSSIVKSELQYRLQDPTVEERNAIFLLAQGTFVNDNSGLSGQAVIGNAIQTASGLLNSVLSGSNDKFDFGVSYEQGYLDPNDVQTEDRIGVTVSTQISDRVLFNGRFGVPVGGVTETVVAGDVEVQVLLNEQGTLRAKIFNRENEIRQFLADDQGYTQGVGLSYEVDFNSFRALLRKVLGKNSAPRLDVKPDSDTPSTVMGRDSLIRVYPKQKTRLP